jgi:Cu(I)/Ag(I) efflux system membrane protein CusA/SilA
MSKNPATDSSDGWIGAVIRFCLEQKLVVLLMVLFIVGWGVIVAPFDWDIDWLPRDPVAVDAIPDIGENQQIVFTQWMGRSPQDVEDQVTYPLTVALLGVPEVKTVRSYSLFGFSSIYVVFKDHVDFYWSRSRLLEKLNSLPAGSLPQGVQPALGPDATALGQVFWYTLEGRGPDGEPEGGWNLDELRSVQDWYVRYGLLSADGVSEVASVGGFVREYQIDVDPDAIRAHGVTLEQVFNAVRMSNIDVGARTIEINRVEYVVRGLGFIESLSDIEQAVVKVKDNVPLTIKDVGTVALGPAIRRGALDKAGAEAVGGVVVVRYGQNPLASIKNVKKKIEELAPGLPTKAVFDWSQVNREHAKRFAKEQGFDAFVEDGPQINQEAWLDWLRNNPRTDWPAWVTTSHVTIVPFYDRSGLIYETLGTLNEALMEEILVTIIVVIVMVFHLRSSLLISSLLPLAVLMTFIAMKTFGVDANIVALSGIAIAIGTMVDMGVVLSENILKHLDEASPDENRLEVIYQAATEVGSAVLTAVATTVVSFLPVFTMIGAEGKLFKPLAFTKTFALIASVIVALTIIPPVAHVLIAGRVSSKRLKQVSLVGLVLIGLVMIFAVKWWVGLIIVSFGVYHLATDWIPARVRTIGPWVANAIACLVVAVFLTRNWLPLGPERGMVRNFIFVAVLIGGLLVFFRLFEMVYGRILRWCLAHKVLFLAMPTVVVVLGACVWLGFDRVFSFVPATAERVGIDPQRIRQASVWTGASDTLPGLGKEFMPPLDEGSFLYMPTTMPHASIGEALDVIQKLDMATAAIPEVDSVVGKLGRAETPLDPAPISMIETVITYKPEYITDKDGHRVNFRYDRDTSSFIRDDDGRLIPDKDGRPFRQWRDHIRTPNDIWKEIEKASRLPGTTGAPKLQPIAARIVMLQSGMRAPMGVKIKGPDLETIERVGLEIERLLKQIPSVEPSAVIADRIVGKPYLEIDIDREAIARYGLKIGQVQEVIEVAIGGKTLTRTVEGRERYPVRVRYQRELRDSIETLGRVLVAAPNGTQVPLSQVSELIYVRGPQVIKSEDTFLVGYVLFDMKPGYAEVDVVEEAQRFLIEKRQSGEFALPAGVSYDFAGNYKNQIRAQEKLAVVLPLALFIIFVILYLQFRSTLTTSLVFSGIIVAWAGGFLMIWLYGQPWFMDFTVFGVEMRELFQVHTINLSVAIWVGFLALFGIASDNGVIVATYLNQSFAQRRPTSVDDIREATVYAGKRRVRPALMTTATTLLALLPVLTSTGRGSDIMVPMAIPSFGGMAIVLVTIYVVPVLYCAIEEIKLKVSNGTAMLQETSEVQVPRN